MKHAAILMSMAMVLLLAPTYTTQPREALAADTLPINFTILPGTQHPGQPVVRSFSYSLDLGAVRTDSLMIVNPSKTSSLSVRLSVSDAVTRAQGGGIEFDDSSNQHFIGQWLQLAASAVTVLPYHITYVPITVHVPSHINPGQFEGAINAIDTEAQTLSAGNVAARVFLNRRCIVLLRVSGKATTGMRVEHAAFASGGAHGVIRFVLRNTGSVLAYPTLIAIVLHGDRAYSLRATAGALTAGAATFLAYQLPERIPPYNYHARISVQFLAAATGDAPHPLAVTWTGHIVVPKS